jgi:leucyl aminopeptidase
METMYDDKTGACTVLEAFKAIVQLGLKLNVVCTVALVENSISGDAYRVSDII